MMSIEDKKRVRGSPRRAVTDESGFGLVEMLVAITIGAVGLMALAGVQLAAASQMRIAEWRTEQALVAQEVFELINERGYAAATGGSYNMMVDGSPRRVNVSITSPALRVKEIRAVVAPIGGVSARTFVTRIYDVRPVPAGP